MSSGEGSSPAPTSPITAIVLFESFPERRLPGLNDYTRVNRRNKYQANELKQDTEELICWQIMRTPHTDVQVDVRFDWYEPRDSRDHDNVSFAQKFLLDAMVECEVIPDDSPKYVRHITHTFHTDSEHPRVVVTLTAVE